MANSQWANGLTPEQEKAIQQNQALLQGKYKPEYMNNEGWEETFADSGVKNYTPIGGPPTAPTGNPPPGGTPPPGTGEPTEAPFKAHPFVDVKERVKENPGETVPERVAYRWGDRMEDAAGRRAERRTIIADWADKKGMKKVAELFRAGSKVASDREKRLKAAQDKQSAGDWQLGDYLGAYFGQGDGSQEMTGGGVGEQQKLDDGKWYPGKYANQFLGKK